MTSLFDLGEHLPFRERTEKVGELTLKPLIDEHDIDRVHQWLQSEHARFWGMQNISREALIAQMTATDESLTLIGYCDDRAMFMAQFYDPASEQIGRHYRMAPGDCGMHFLIAPPAKGETIAGFSRTVLRSILRCAFQSPAIDRIVVEPDVTNGKIHPVNEDAGVFYTRTVTLSDKTAYLGFATRESLKRASGTGSIDDGKRATISASAWHTASRSLVRKILCEFCHERIIAPRPMGPADSREGSQSFELWLDGDRICYRFSGCYYQLDHLAIDTDSITRVKEGKACEPDALALINELKDHLTLPESLFPIYLEEITSTLYARAYWLQHGPALASDLADADYQTIEQQMIDGHPVFIANNGRIGFDLDDYHQFAPEIGGRVSPVWLALRHTKLEQGSLPDWPFERLWAHELGEQTVKHWREQLRRQNLEPDDYQFMPVHPWQWKEKIARSFAADIARRDIVYLGVSDDAYQPQQSIRTLFNRSRPDRCYLKTALSILNMGFMRGLSPDYMARTPVINQWLAELVDSDPAFARWDFRILREVAAIGYRSDVFDTGASHHSPYRKMLSAVWRESPVDKIGSKQELMTMAALLHCDDRGESLVGALIERSGLSAEQWLARYLRVYLTPLLHSFYAYDLVFMPHGENLILILEDHCPVGTFMKDIGEEIAVLNATDPLPERVADLAVELEEDMKINYIFLDVFDCFFRFLVPLITNDTELEETDFWREVARTVRQYQEEHPQFNDKFRRYDLFKPDFVRTCLNRIQLNNNQQMIDLDDREKNLQLQGTLANPLAAFADAHRPPGATGSPQQTELTKESNE